ncbi:MAG: D-alanyl-D-alanine carboxypeptidase [Clostridiales bacterium]|nr:D-alanyl-D-alanine carboxypeptidase [Clostridiales bacterium]
MVDLLKKCLSVLLAVSFLLPVMSREAQAASVSDISAASAAVIVAQTGELLYGKNEHEKRGMASTTKIMTALLACEAGTPEREITVTAEMLAVEGTSMGLLAGDKVTLDGLVYGMLLESGNDAANVTAYTLAGNIDSFAALMNAKAHEIGMADTSFANPSGLTAENHYSTAYDMALLGAYAMKNMHFRETASRTSARVSYGNPPYMRTLTNHNRLLRSYDGAIGIKTGFTKASGRCLVSAAERNGVTLVAVTLKAPNDWADHTKLLDYGFSLVENKQADTDFSDIMLSVVGGTASGVKTVAGTTVDIAVRSSSDFQPERRVYIEHFLYAPVKAGRVVGRAEYLIDGNVVAQVQLVAENDVPAVQPQQKEKGFLYRVKEFFIKLFAKAAA